MTRRPLMAGNWKMFKTIGEGVDLVKKLSALVPSHTDRDVLVCPPFTSLAAVAQAAKGSPISVGAQNMNDNLQGAFTGEVAPGMIKDAGASFVLVGHSERRQIYKETDILINKKARLALEQGLTPIVCVGETLEERESGKTFSVVERHVTEGLKGFSAAQAPSLVIAYEPVWAIGTGKTATPDQAQEVHAFIRRKLEVLFGTAAAQVRVLYGGSVKPDNIDTLMAQPDIDGGLVGGASLKAEDFARIVNFKKI
ncbi:MAG: triose-phosphate isomerase [Elusimicrobia bacterium]|nr:triose-phosphate isomerase [Elusimicrobiota bacterium]